MKTKKEYIAPKLKEYAYMAEEGFADSTLNPGDPNQETWEDNNEDLGGGGWNWN